MAESTTLIFRVPLRAKRQLAELAERTSRIQSALAAAAITEYVERELAAIDEMEQRRADFLAEKLAGGSALNISERSAGAL